MAAIDTLGSSYTVFQTIEQMHDYLDRSGEVFEYGNTASPDSHSWRGQPVPLPVLRVVMDWPFALSDWKYFTAGMVNCLQCGKPIPYQQGTCPHCGYKEF